MIRWIALAALWGGTALAQPVLHPETEACHVSIAYAPEDVRAEIEAWVRAEPRCERELEVRVIPTDDGLYLQARDASGRVRERVVPDAQSAAVLVVSWMADDSLGPTHAPMLEPPSASIGSSDAELPPEMGGVIAHPTPRSRARRWLTLGAIGSDTGGGFRGQVDVFAGRRWSVGVSGGWRGDRESHDGIGQARVVFSTSRELGPFSMRVQLGVGADVSEADPMDGDTTQMRHRGHENVVPRAEAAMFARLRITGDWGVIGGPIVEGGPRDDKPSLSLVLGVQRGL